MKRLREQCPRCGRRYDTPVMEPATVYPPDRIEIPKDEIYTVKMLCGRCQMITFAQNVERNLYAPIDP